MKLSSLLFVALLNLNLQAYASDPVDTSAIRPETKRYPSESKESGKWLTFRDRDVENQNGDELGKVTEIALDMKNGRIAAVLVTHGGLIGLGERTVGVPAGAFTNVKEGGETGTLILNVSKETFDAAPILRRSHWQEYFQAENLARVYRYFGVDHPYFTAPGMAPGDITFARKLNGLPVLDGASKMGRVTAVRVDAVTSRLMFVVTADNAAIFAKSEILASQAHLNATHDALILNPLGPNGNAVKQPSSVR